MNKTKIACIVVQLIIFAVLIVCGLLLLGWLGEEGYIEAFLLWVQDLGYIGMLVMIGALICVHIPFSFGYSIVGMACGALFQFLPGLGVIVIGCGIGSQVGYWLTRLLLQKRVSEVVAKSRPEVVALMQEVGTNPWKISIMVRFIPIPIGFQNAMLGMSPVRYWVYVISSLLGMFPEEVIFVYVGASAREIAAIVAGKNPGWAEWALLAFSVLGVVMLIVVFVYIGKRAMATAKQLQAEAALRDGVELTEVVEEGDARIGDELEEEEEELVDPVEGQVVGVGVDVVEAGEGLTSGASLPTTETPKPPKAQLYDSDTAHTAVDRSVCREHVEMIVPSAADDDVPLDTKVTEAEGGPADGGIGQAVEPDMDKLIDAT
eukprot:TRINITY_DN2043_c0_g1_i1.p1 TRINITY_DN2043_c0_g1~~TRINITY_DN2043_c0_g1_i1.p1  ORF type:complete len:375 (-),score=112.90 TRINITY_DN2043_c0_g1_i1:831-1955(-)